MPSSRGQVVLIARSGTAAVYIVGGYGEEDTAGTTPCYIVAA
jgi:hypothetical protein